MPSTARRSHPSSAESAAARQADQHAYVAFRGAKLIASGNRSEVVRGVFREGGDRRQGAVLVFDAVTSQPLELDLRGTEAESLARLRTDAEGALGAREAARATGAPEADAPTEKRGPGRPRLGVIPRELTLLPRHWDWLTAQPGGASAAVRRLVDQARGAAGTSARETRRSAQESAYRFLSAMGGDQPGFEAATRALFAVNSAEFELATARWPKDLRVHARQLARAAFAIE